MLRFAVGILAKKKKEYMNKVKLINCWMYQIIHIWRFNILFSTCVFLKLP